MNPEKRPTAVLVLAIFNFILGGAGILSNLCGGVMLLLLGKLASIVPTPPGQPNPMDEITGLYNSIPGFYAFTIADAVLSIGLGILLIVAGVGLLKVKPQGRTLSLVYAVAKIVVVVAGAVYAIGYVQPASEAWTKEFMAKMTKQQPPGTPVPSIPTLGPGGSIAAGVMSSLMYLVYPIVLLVLLNTPTIKAAFYGGPGRDPWDDGPEDDRPDDGPDDDERPLARDRAERDDRTEIMPDPPRPRPLPPPESREDPPR